MNSHAYIPTIPIYTEQLSVNIPVEVEANTDLQVSKISCFHWRRFSSDCVIFDYVTVEVYKCAKSRGLKYSCNQHIVFING